MIDNIAAKNPDLKQAEVIGLLHILKTHQSLTNNELIRLTGISKPLITNFKTSISNLLADPKGDELVLSQDLSKIETAPYDWTLLSLENQDIEDKLAKIRHDYDLAPKRQFDQFFATPRSSVGKVLMLKAKGLITGRHIALIGDDDLVSMTLSLLDTSYDKITIFEIDPDISGTIKKIALEYGFNKIEIIQQDVRKEFLNQHMGRYDVVLIDPPYTRSGVELFLLRAIQLLKTDSSTQGKYVLLNFGAGRKFPEKTLKVQEIINAFGILIEDKINKFTRYFGAETVGSASSMYVLKTTPHTNISHTILTDQIYTFETDPLEKFPYVDHFVFKVKKVDEKLITSKSALLNIFGKFCKIHKLNVVDTNFTKFKGKGLPAGGQGFSITFILASSNLLVHTWPEHGALHIDLVTCSPIYKKESLAYTLSNLLSTKYVETKRVE